MSEKTCNHDEPQTIREVNDDKTWLISKDSFPVTDVRYMNVDPFNLIMELAGKTAEGEGFAIIQRFEPIPLINVLTGQGFLYLTEKIADYEFKIYFYRPITDQISLEKGKEKNKQTTKTKVPVVIQSATPVAYPIILRMLQSSRLNELIEVEELKFWQETEKHMGWITNGKADFTFSAVLASSKLYTLGQDIRFLSINVWDNFYLITRGKKIESLKELKGRTIHLPLYQSAPPFAITAYLMKKEGLNPADFNFQFGEPFGRPEELKERLVKGEIDTVLLRQPEASFALESLKKEEVYVLNYGDLWRKYNPELVKLPNAGLVVKGEFYRNHKEIVEVFMEELKLATEWVKKNPFDAALLSHQEMKVSLFEALRFCEDVFFEHKEAKEVKTDIQQYIEVLRQENVIKIKKPLDDYFFGKE